MKNKENLELLAEKICQVDAVLIGVVPGFPVQQAIITTIGCLIWKDSCRILKKHMAFNLPLQDFIIAILHQNNSGLFTHAIYKVCGMPQRGRLIMTWRRL